MIINRALLKNGVPTTFVDTIDFSNDQFDPTHIRKIEDCSVEAIATDYETILRVEVKIKAKVIGVCSYSLEDVELNLKIEDELNFTDDEEDVDNYYEKGNLINLDSYVLGILLANIPVRIVKKGAKLPENGKDYRVISEEDYEQEKSKEVDHRFDILDSIEFSDDEKK